MFAIVPSYLASYIHRTQAQHPKQNNMKGIWEATWEDIVEPEAEDAPAGHSFIS